MKKPWPADNVHESHDMTEWASDIVSIVETPRFGLIRECRNCGGEHAKTAGGEGMHDELKVTCLYQPERKE